ncbi:uncharacterized protein FIBRA_07107 [Fibroporia radiculosa]|uniref:Uncharacterized protein n=1 Tax=Fibroporia radiculosa TaxID=599839 RepID=J4GUC9_9APHY|nr:uncharacterized protein FIBRA_07107 [Fibroporia radiculosa]CCM04910.1 predicted protein [Fibroporia radiculosa]
MPSVIEEVTTTLEEFVPTKSDGWVAADRERRRSMLDEMKNLNHRDPIDFLVQCTLASDAVALHTLPLHEEFETAIEQEGWTKAAMCEMRTADSFLKESARVDGLGMFSPPRKALTDLTLSNDTLTPMGNLFTAAATATHLHGEFYDRPEAFEHFRFSDERAEESEKNRHHLVTPSAECPNLSHGKHACPCRFFAANEPKVILANVVLSDDIKFADKARPKNES